MQENTHTQCRCAIDKFRKEARSLTPTSYQCLSLDLDLFCGLGDLESLPPTMGSYEVRNGPWCEFGLPPWLPPKRRTAKKIAEVSGVGRRSSLRMFPILSAGGSRSASGVGDLNLRDNRREQHASHICNELDDHRLSPSIRGRRRRPPGWSDTHLDRTSRAVRAAPSLGVGPQGHHRRLS